MFILGLLISVLCQNESTKLIELTRPSIHLGIEEESIDTGQDVNKVVFQSIKALEITESDTLYVLDSGQNQIFKINLQGNLLSVIGNKGQGPGEFDNPQSLAVSGEYMWVADYGNGRIQIFKDDTYYKSFKLDKPTAPHNTLVLKEKIFISGSSIGEQSGSIKLFQPDGQYIKELNWFSKRNSEKGLTRGLWNNVLLMPFSDSKILIGYLYDNAIAIISEDGSPIQERDMDDFYSKYEDKNKRAIFPAGYSAMSFSEGPENTILVAVCDQEKRYCGSIFRFDQTLTKLIQRIDIGFSPTYMKYEPALKMLFLSSVQAEIFVYDIP